MQSQKCIKNVNWNVKETFLYLTAFDWIKLLRSEAATRGVLLKLYLKRLWHRYFHVNFVNFLRTLFLQNTSERLLLYVLKKCLLCPLSKFCPNSPLLFVLVFWGETNRSSLSQMKFLLATLLKRDSNTGVFVGNFRNFKEHIVLHIVLPAFEQTQEISVVHCVAVII